jgi:hypothetical protein
VIASGRSIECQPKRFLALLLRTVNDISEVHALELWILVRQYIRLHIAEWMMRPARI